MGERSGTISNAHRDPKNYNSLVESDQLRNIIKQQSDMAAISVEVLKNRGAVILEVDMEDTQEKNLLEIQKFISKLNANNPG